MTTEYEKARAKRIEENFKRRNPGKTPLRAVFLRPKRTKRISTTINLTGVDRLLLASTWRKEDTCSS